MSRASTQYLADFAKASANIRRRYNTPEKMREFLVQTGIYERATGTKTGLRLAGPYRTPAKKSGSRRSSKA